MQLGVVNLQSFRKMLEFCTIVAENDDKTKKMVYQCRLRLPQGLSLVVQVSGGALARTSSVAPSIKSKSKFSGK
jgi:hypothetical protein